MRDGDLGAWCDQIERNMENRIARAARNASRGKGPVPTKSLFVRMHDLANAARLLREQLDADRVKRQKTVRRRAGRARV